ncbi:amino acid permease-like protein, putative [Bodo saltans]|uniref:Amino acid permease-like protein, putative n=1 Tax=Bodo saltans TaxID=75058 RepID=A0A0S4IV32_BODSA|nr:amino acid permease-like protein, putative [Bodo saltans]|eukprot:CUF03719.1 amino acid permease-like protein, putative [Bodo saltans]
MVILSPGPINGAALNLAVGVFGVSILAMPSAFLGVGVVGGIAIITGVGILTVVSIYFLSVAMEALSLYSYEGLSRRLLGPWSVRAARWMLFMFNFGDCVSYLIAGGRLLEPLHALIARSLAGTSSSAAQWLAAKMLGVEDPALLWTVAYWVLVLLPLSFVRRVTVLERLSGLAVCALLYIVGAVVYRYWVPLEGGLKIAPVFSDPVPLLDALAASINGIAEDRAALASRVVRGFLSVPVIMFAFDCQALIFQLYTSLEQPHRSVDSMLKVTTRAIGAAWAVYITIGVFGYLTLGDATPDNILRAYDASQDPVFAAAYAMFLVPATVAFALVLFPVRDVVFEMLEDSGWVSPSVRVRYSAQHDHFIPNKIDQMSPTTEDSQDTEDRPMMPDPTVADDRRIHRAVSGTLSFLCLAVAIIAPRLDVVFALLGGMCSSGLCFVFPAAFRLRLGYEAKIPITDGSGTQRIAWSMVLVGVFAAVYGTAAGILEATRQ